MDVTTQVDSVGIKIVTDNSVRQRDILTKLKKYISSINPRISVISKNRLNGESRLSIDYLVMLDGKNVLAKIIAGASPSNDGTRYYINIVCAGVKSYDDEIDDIKDMFLITIVSWCNDKKISFNIRELDCNIDVNCPFENLHVIQVKRLPKNRFGVEEEQMYKKTIYLQKKRKNNSTTPSALYYDKQHKEGLDEGISRFELKLVFNKSDYINLDMLYSKIIKSFSRYAVYCFNDLNTKQQVINHQYNIEKINAPRSRVYNKLTKDLYAFQLHPDINYIINYIQRLYTVRGYKMILKDRYIESNLNHSIAVDFDTSYADLLNISKYN